MATKRAREPPDPVPCAWCKRIAHEPVGCPAGGEQWMMEFCTYECADAYSQCQGQVYYRIRHELLEHRAGRRVSPAPWLQGASAVECERGIAQSREQLSAVEMQLAKEQDMETMSLDGAGKRLQRTS